MTSQDSTMKRQDSLSRRPLSKAMLPVQGEALEALGDLGDFNSSVTSLFNKYASNEISSTEEFSGDVKATTALRRKTRTEQNEHELFMELIYDIQHELNVERLCFKILHNIAVLTNCDRSSLFLTRKEGDQKFLVCKLFDLTSNSLYEDVVRSEDSTFIVPFGTGVIGHVAESKEFVQINNAYEDERFNRAIDLQTGYKTYSILCMPIVDSNSDVVGVAQIINKCTGEKDNIESHKFTEQDMLVFKKYLMFCGIGITNAQLFQLSMQEYRCNRLLLMLARSIFKENTSLDKLVEQIMTQSLEIVQCESCHVFLCNLDAADDRAFTDIFTLKDGSVSSEKWKKEALVDGDAVGYGRLVETVAISVVKTGQTFCAKRKEDVSEKLTDTGTEPPSDIPLSSIICTPIKNASDEVIAVGLMVNKRDGVFSTSDVAAFEGFVIYCGLGIQNTRMYENINRLNNFQQVCIEMLSYHATIHEDETKPLETKKISKEKGDLLETADGIPTAELSDEETVLSASYMFHRLALVQSYSINNKTLIQWIGSVKKNYRNVEFHNWRHALSVAQTMFWLLLQSDIGAVMTQLEKLCLIAACFCHDLDHRGTNNAFQKKAKSPLAALHSASTMEHHHLDMAILILNTRGNNILESLPAEDYQRAIFLLKHCILSTDLALHFKTRDEWKENIVSKLPNVDWSLDEYKLPLMSMLMTAADLGASTKSWEVQLDTAAHISEEFYQQGDLEKLQLKTEPIALMDRKLKDQLPQMQIDFFDNVCLPLYKSLSEAFKSVNKIKDSCLRNRENWNSLRETGVVHSEQGTKPTKKLTKHHSMDQPSSPESSQGDSTFPVIDEDDYVDRMKSMQSPLHVRKIQSKNTAAKPTPTNCTCSIS